MAKCEQIDEPQYVLTLTRKEAGDLREDLRETSGSALYDVYVALSLSLGDFDI